MIVRSLLEDGRLRMEVHPPLLSALARWLPHVPADTPADPSGSVIRVLAGDAPPPARPARERTLQLGKMDAWVEGDRTLLAGPSGVHGLVRLDAGEAELRVPREAEGMAWDLFTASTLACALLLGRMGRPLVHAAAVAPPGGRAWLLVGDTHAGKTTTSANLLRTGWSYVSDDHVVLHRDAQGRIAVEGLPRAFHLDEGWETGQVRRRRGSTDPRERFPGAWRRTAPLAGLLFPRIHADEPTALAPAGAGEALGALVRQSPWLLADRGCAPRVLALLRETALLPAHALRLGLDTYADPPLLAERLGALRDAGGDGEPPAMDV
ncbi:MAG TPA: hypothetical protein VF006_00760 [Longimicrobium sp.]